MYTVLLRYFPLFSSAFFLSLSELTGLLLRVLSVVYALMYQFREVLTTIFIIGLSNSLISFVISFSWKSSCRYIKVGINYVFLYGNWFVRFFSKPQFSYKLLSQTCWKNLTSCLALHHLYTFLYLQFSWSFHSQNYHNYIPHYLTLSEFHLICHISY